MFSCLSQMIKNPPANAGHVRDVGSIPGLGRSPGGGQGIPLQYSCLENPMDRGACFTPWGHMELDMTEVTHACPSWRKQNIIQYTDKLYGLLNGQSPTPQCK